MVTRRDLFGAGLMGFSGLGLGAAPLVGSFPRLQPERALFPCPSEGAEAGVNPPGFAWWRVDKAASYRLTVQGASGRTVYQAAGLPDPVHLPNRTLPPGKYTWDVEALDSRGQAIASRGAMRFSVGENVPELPWEDPKSILARVPDSHPRYIFLQDQLPQIRDSLKTTRRTAWEAVKKQADQALKAPLPEPPRYHTFEGKTRQRMGYAFFFRDFRKRVDSTLSALSAAWLLGGDERYGERAKKILLEIESWGVEGPMSVLSPFGDEPGLSMGRHGHRAYDWLYPLFTAGERERVREMTIARARQMLARLRKADYLAKPAESHNGRMIAYLSEYAVTLKGEAPDAAEWLDYSLRALTTFYPHWGDTDGGWAEGVSYALAYNTIYLGALESLRAAAGFDLYKRPFFRNVRRFFLYCASPKGEIKPYGDGSERGGVGSTGAVLLTHFGRRLQDPACVWWAQQTGERAVEPMVSLATEDTVAARAPVDLSQAALFRGIGWAALHSGLHEPDRDTFLLFKSSPFGSVSHSHADQNSFCILKGGKALAIPSGHYGPAYSMPHHAEWTRQTKANNSILVNGEGQVVRDANAGGKIAGFRHQKALTYFRGDAAAAYQGKLKRFLRHVVFLRPGVFLMLDDLEAPAPAQFQWLLHAFEQMTVDEREGTVISSRGGASLTVRLHCEAELEFGQTDVFDTPYNEGNPAEYQQKMDNHWHFKASTRNRAAAARIAALMIVRDQSDRFTTGWRQHKGWQGIAVKSGEGTGEAWVQTTPGAAGPAGFHGDVRDGRAVMAARWRPVQGAEESITA